jgi:iron complex outermembrane receptor protein
MRRDRACLAGERRLGGMRQRGAQLGRTATSTRRSKARARSAPPSKAAAPNCALQAGTRRIRWAARCAACWARRWSAGLLRAGRGGLRARHHARAARPRSRWRSGSSARWALSAGARGAREGGVRRRRRPAPRSALRPATERSFSPGSSGHRWATGRQHRRWTVSAGLGRTERAPTYYELYANGVHVATGAFERGDALLGIERSTPRRAAGLQWQRRPRSQRQGPGVRHALLALHRAGPPATTSTSSDEGDTETFPEYRFARCAARLRGFELEGRTRVAELPWALDLTGAARSGARRPT